MFLKYMFVFNQGVGKNVRKVLHSYEPKAETDSNQMVWNAVWKRNVK